jgi:hypothetical protein
MTTRRESFVNNTIEQEIYLVNIANFGMVESYDILVYIISLRLNIFGRFRSIFS